MTSLRPLANRAVLLALHGSAAAAVLAASLATAAFAQGTAAKRPMVFGVQTHFSQEWPLDVLTLADKVGAPDLRDGMNWALVEPEKGGLRFDSPQTTFPDAIKETGRSVSLTFAGTSDFYDAGGTPHTDEGRAAYARFIEATLARHPFVRAVEVGNEFNAQNFVSGVVLDAPYDERPRYYAELLKAVDDVVSPSHPDVAILGGATHSIPIAYLSTLFELGAAEHMDGLAIHPYGIPPEDLPGIIGALRQRMPDPDLPIHATEFGIADPDAAPAYMLKMVCVMAALGFERAVWYNLLGGDVWTEPLFATDGTPTPAAAAYAFIQEHLLTGPMRDVSPDPFTYAFQPSETAMVVWGEPRSIAATRPDIRAYTPLGEELDMIPHEIDPDTPLILLSRSPFALGDGIDLGRQKVIVDSFHQFSYERRPDSSGDGDPFQRFAVRDGELVNLAMLGGGESANFSWNPRLGDPYLNPSEISAEWLTPAVFPDPNGGEPSIVQMVHRYSADEDMSVALEAEWTPSERTSDGVSLSVYHNDELVFWATTREGAQLNLKSLVLESGDRLDFVVGPRFTSEGDTTRYRYRILRASLTDSLID